MVWAGSVWADAWPAKRCAFTAECFEAEGCSETAFSVELTVDRSEGANGGGMRVVMSGDAGDVVLTGVAEGGQSALGQIAPDAQHLLTIDASGAARYSVHYTEGPMMIGYLGHCEVAP